MMVRVKDECREVLEAKAVPNIELISTKADKGYEHENEGK